MSAYENLIRRQSITNDRTIVFQYQGEAPAPVRDFYNILITGTGVAWRKWRISPQAVTAGAITTPDESVCSHEDFLDYEIFNSDISSLLGKDVLTEARAAVEKYIGRSAHKLSLSK